MTKKIYFFIALLAAPALQLQATGCTGANLTGTTGNYCAGSTGNYIGAATGAFIFNTTAPRPESPCTPSAIANNDYSATITWTYTSIAQTPFSGVALYYSTNDLTWLCLDPNVPFDSTSYTTAPLPIGNYSFMVASIYESGGVNYYYLSNPSNTIAITPTSASFITINSIDDSIDAAEKYTFTGQYIGIPPKKIILSFNNNSNTTLEAELIKKTLIWTATTNANTFETNTAYTATCTATYNDNSESSTSRFFRTKPDLTKDGGANFTFCS